MSQRQIRILFILLILGHFITIYHSKSTFIDKKVWLLCNEIRISICNLICLIVQTLQEAFTVSHNITPTYLIFQDRKDIFIAKYCQIVFWKFLSLRSIKNCVYPKSIQKKNSNDKKTLKMTGSLTTTMTTEPTMVCIKIG